MKQEQMSKMVGTAAILYAFALTGCQAPLKEELLPSLSAEKPSQVMAVVESALMQVGESLESNGQAQGGQSVQGKVQAQVSQVDQLCDEHATPLDDQGGQLDSQNGAYPSRLFYCKLAKNTGSPDSVPGSFHIQKAISCAFENAGVVFDNQEHQVQVVLDTNCFSQQQLSDIGQVNLTATVRASKPAFFNTYYDTGIQISLPGHGQIRMAAKVSGTTLEFLTHEDQTSVSANKTGVYAASFDLVTGKLRFESRSDRFLCSEQNSCGWSRHDRLVAQVGLTGGVISSVSQIEGLASEIFDNGNGQYSARLSTIKGNLNQGLKARYYTVSANNSDDLADPTKYQEVVNNLCRTYTLEQADCGANAGIDLPQQGSFVFSLHPTAQPMSAQAWADQLVGLKFETVSFSDIQ